MISEQQPDGRDGGMERHLDQRHQALLDNLEDHLDVEAGLRQILMPELG
ncbi:hypothetical protein AB0J38_01810 [Streptomyces sp. NPDC050095]